MRLMMVGRDIDIARRARGAAGFRWLPGMQWRRLAADGAPALHRVTGETGVPAPHCVPDLADPVTVLALLALVREAWGDPFLVTANNRRADAAEWWWVETGSGPLTGEDARSEAEALVSTLCTGPPRPRGDR